jgi:hypothetical protein
MTVVQNILILGETGAKLQFLPFVMNARER